MSWNRKEPDDPEAAPSPHCSQMSSPYPWPFGDQSDTYYQACWCRGSCFLQASASLSKHPLSFPVVPATLPLPCNGQTDGRGWTSSQTGTKEHAAQPRPGWLGSGPSSQPQPEFASLRWTRWIRAHRAKLWGNGVGVGWGVRQG